MKYREDIIYLAWHCRLVCVNIRYTCTHTCIYTYMCMYIYVCMYTYTHIKETSFHTYTPIHKVSSFFTSFSVLLLFLKMAIPAGIR